MNPVASLTAGSELVDAIRTQLIESSHPLQLSEIAKRLPRPKKFSAADFQSEVRRIIEEAVHRGEAFAYPSAKKGETRYWSRDEKRVLLEKARELASIPQPLAALCKKLVKQCNGTDPGFVTELLQESTRNGHLFEHPGKAGKSGPMLGSVPCPPPLPILEQVKHRKAVERLVHETRKLLESANVTLEEVIELLRRRLSLEQTCSREVGSSSPLSKAEPTLGLDELILKAVEHTPILSLADLRREMPPEYQGEVFDQTVLRLADAQKVSISQPEDPERFSEEDRRHYVRDGMFLYTTITAWR